MHLKKLSLLKNITLLFFFTLTISCEDDAREVTLFEKGSLNATASSTAIESGGTVTFTDESTKVFSREWTFPNGNPSTSTDAEVTVAFNNPSFTDAAVIEAKLNVVYIDNQREEKTFSITVDPTDALPDPIPFGGTAVDIPGTIEAEDYDEGGQGVGYNDAEEENQGESYSDEYRIDDGPDVEGSGDTFNIGYTNADEWLNYTVNVTETGVYNFEFLVASGSGDGGKSIKLQHVAALTGEITELGETGDFANTGGWSSYVPVVVPDITLVAGINTLRLQFTGGSTNIDKINVTPSGGSISYNIAFVTDNAASDATFITLLEDGGHQVEAVDGAYNNLDNAGAATLNGFDLVIISRNTNSGNFSDGARPAWQTVTTPILNLSSYVARSTRLQFFNSANQNEGGGTIIKAADPAHPLFTNVTLDVNNEVAVTAVDLHVVVGTDPGNGTLVGTTADGADATIGIWEANTASYVGGEVFAAKRMFLSGTGGGYSYNEAGAQLYLNAVEYLLTGAVTGTFGTPGGGGPSVTPLNIAFASDQLDEGGQDLPYVALLEAQGHTVDAVSGAWNNLDAAGATALNGYDLVIISRNTNSGNFGDAARPNWATVTTPIMNLSAYVNRNNRLQLLNTGGFIEGSSTTLTVADANDPIWIGVSVTDGVTEAITGAGLHVSDVTDAGNGAIIAFDPDSGNIAIAEWDANTASYDGADTFAAKRMFFATNGGAYALTSAGETLFLNAISRLTN